MIGRLWLYVAKITASVIFVALVVDTFPGIIPVALVAAAFWWAKPEPDWDKAYEALLRETS